MTSIIVIIIVVASVVVGVAVDGCLRRYSSRMRGTVDRGETSISLLIFLQWPTLLDIIVSIIIIILGTSTMISHEITQSP